MGRRKEGKSMRYQGNGIDVAIRMYTSVVLCEYFVPVPVPVPVPGAEGVPWRLDADLEAARDLARHLTVPFLLLALTSSFAHKYEYLAVALAI